LIITGAVAESLLWPYTAVRLTQGQYPGEQVRLEKGDGPGAEVLLLQDPAVLDRLRLLAPHLVGRLTGPSHERARIGFAAMAAAAAIAVAAGLYLWGIPAVAHVLAPRVPAAWEVRLGESVVAHLAPADRRCTAPPVNEAMRQLVDKLRAGAPAAPYPIRVIIVRDRQANAFAVPGGTVVVLTGLLEITSSPEELAAVLAHELQHIFRRHATRALLEHASAGLILTALMGDATGILAFGLEGARTLAVLRYSRRNEEEADAEGLRMMVAAGIDPRGMLAFLKRLEAKEGPTSLPTYLSTHPDTGARIARLRGAAAAQTFPPVALPGVQDWQAIARGCGPAGPTR
jgi:predicted Zn-dependent protease